MAANSPIGRLASWLYYSIIIISLLSNAQVTLSSRKFLTGLIIGTLLARNGMQGPVYSSPPQPAYPVGGGGGGGQGQQPLFIIIPSGNSHRKRSSYKGAEIMRTSPNMYNHILDSSYGPDQLSHRSIIRPISSKRPMKRRRPRKQYIRGLLDKTLGPTGQDLSKMGQFNDKLDLVGPSNDLVDTTTERFAPLAPSGDSSEDSSLI